MFVSRSMVGSDLGRKNARGAGRRVKARCAAADDRSRTACDGRRTPAGGLRMSGALHRYRLALAVLRGALRPPRARHRPARRGAAAARRRAVDPAGRPGRDEGLTLVGPAAALAGRRAPELDDLSRADAARLADLPRANLFFRGAFCRWNWRFRSPVLLTFELPKAIFARTSLPLYRLHNGRWRAPAPTGGRRRRQPDGDRHHRAARPLRRVPHARLEGLRGGRLPAGRVHAPLPDDDVLSPVVLASGSTTDPGVIQAVMDVSGQTEDQARSTLAQLRLDRRSRCRSCA